MSDCLFCGVCDLDFPSEDKDKHGWGVCGFADVMVDIETLGTSPNAAIVQIAAVRFDPFLSITGSERPGMIGSPDSSFNFYVEPTGNPNIDGDLEWSTVSWWLKQSKEAQQRVFEPAGGRGGHIGMGVSALVEWLSMMPFKRVWAAGPQFDLVLLKKAYQRTHPTLSFISSEPRQFPAPSEGWPITYGMERDFRTLREVGKLRGVPEPVRVGVAHDALDDCFHQVTWAIEILRAVKQGERQS